MLFVLRNGENLLALKQSNSFFYRHIEKNVFTCVGLKRQWSAKWNIQANKDEVTRNYKSGIQGYWHYVENYINNKLAK